MNIEFERVFERDVDLLIMNNFINNREFKNYFLSKINLKDFEVIEVKHSLMDNDGETDIMVIMTNGVEKIALLIEDKIDARAMPNQKSRYDRRGLNGIKQKLYDKFYVFLVAPLDYLYTNQEAQKYENKISYESLLKLFKNDKYAYSLISTALSKKKKGYEVIENKTITTFWNKYYDYIKNYYPQLKMNMTNTAKGSNALWPHIFTPLKNVYILHKSNKGFMDMTFSGMGDCYYQFKKEINNYLDNDMSIQRTGKALAIRVNVPVVDFNNDFDNYIDEINVSLNSAVRLLNLCSKLDLQKVIDDITNKNV